MGYDGYSMSERARIAYDTGEKPLSKWTKAAIVEEIDRQLAEDYSPEEIGFDPAKLKALPLKALKELVLKYSSWHHTGAKYKKTGFYEVQIPKGLTDEQIELAKQTAAQSKETEAEEKPVKYRGDIRHLVWFNSKATERVLRDVWIEEKGQFYIVTDDDGRLLLRKKINSRGTDVTKLSEEDHRRRLIEREAQLKVGDIWRQICVIAAMGISTRPAAVREYIATGSLEELHDKAVEKLRQKAEPMIEQWRKLPPDHWRHETIKLYETDIDTFAFRQDFAKYEEKSPAYKTLLDYLRQSLKA